MGTAEMRAASMPTVAALAFRSSAMSEIVTRPPEKPTCSRTVRAAISRIRAKEIRVYVTRPRGTDDAEPIEFACAAVGAVQATTPEEPHVRPLDAPRRPLFRAFQRPRERAHAGGPRARGADRERRRHRTPRLQHR